MIVKRAAQNGVSPEDELDVEYDSAPPSTGDSRGEPPPSYEASSTPHTSLSDEAKDKSPRTDTLEDQPSQIAFDDLISGSSYRSIRRSMPVLSPKPGSPLETREEQKPGPSQQHPHPPLPSQHFASSPELPPQSATLSNPSARSRLHAAHSPPDPRVRAKLEHINDRDPFGHKFYDEGPFAVARRAQRAEMMPGNEVIDIRVYANGLMPSFKPGEIIPVNTMRPATTVPPSYFLPHQAPSFPPVNYPPIRPAHFPPQLHPPQQPQQPQQLQAPPTRMPSQRHSPPSQTRQSLQSPQSAQAPQSVQAPQAVQAPRPIQSQLHGQLLSVQGPQAVPQQATRHSPPALHPAPQQPPPLLTRAASRRQTPSPQGLGQYPNAVPPPQPSNLSVPPASRRHTYDPRAGVPSGSAPNGRPMGSSPQAGPSPNGYPQSQSQAYPRGNPSGMMPRAPYLSPHSDRPIHAQPPRRSVQGTPSPPLFAQSPSTPVRLPSQNVPPPSPPRPPASPRPESSRAPRLTPTPVMPPLLAPLAAQENFHGRRGATQLQRSLSTMPSQKSGLLSKTRSILRKRSSTPGIKTHADGSITLSPQPPSAKRYENHPPLTPVREESTMGKLSKRLSKRR